LLGEGENIPNHSLNFLCLLEVTADLYSRVITPFLKVKLEMGWWRLVFYLALKLWISISAMY